MSAQQHPEHIFTVTPTTPSSQQQPGKRRRVEWTKVEEVCLVEILSENVDWAAVLIHNRSNDRGRGATKTGIAKEIGLRLWQHDPPDLKTVIQNVKQLKDRFKKWFNTMSQTGQGFLLAELHADSQLLRDRNRIIVEEPWFDMFHKLYIDRQPADSPDIFTGGFSQLSSASTSFGIQNLQLNSNLSGNSQQVEEASDEEDLTCSLGEISSLPSLDTLAKASQSPLPSTSARNRSQSAFSSNRSTSQLSRGSSLQKKRPYSIFQDSQIESITQSQQHISDNNLEAIRIQNEQQRELRQAGACLYGEDDGKDG
ncbi:uncharacterized protein SRS1_02163 [Sporisorium reilianum f. sp. reilianum]|uniref:Myb/SANT-like domain-containing protein n=1 Tax=Sporisorium reilianum f. sp. reilianum TaxID=72559 RepID=A0A2N8UDR5_9BASI|nr:uncharacterized protein SRS1_02163 [Sporisorium reilianum f. sp. reilianum]